MLATMKQWQSDSIVQMPKCHTMHLTRLTLLRPLDYCKPQRRRMLTKTRANRKLNGRMLETRRSARGACVRPEEA